MEMSERKHDIMKPTRSLLHYGTPLGIKHDYTLIVASKRIFPSPQQCILWILTWIFLILITQFLRNVEELYNFTMRNSLSLNPGITEFCQNFHSDDSGNYIILIIYLNLL